MAKYLNFRYIFPPRPKNAISPNDLNFWDSGSLLAQPKLNGSNCLIFTNGVKSIAMNRHNSRLSNFNLSDNEVMSIYKGDGWCVLNGEYLNKNKLDENGNPFNHKFVIFDILVYNGQYLVGKTFEERIKLLDEIYGTKECEKPFLYGISENIYRVKSYTSNFVELYRDLVYIDMVEGLVLKRKSARLELGTSENNNTKSQLKARKPTKNYKY